MIECWLIQNADLDKRKVFSDGLSIGPIKVPENTIRAHEVVEKKVLNQEILVFGCGEGGIFIERRVSGET